MGTGNPSARLHDKGARILIEAIFAGASAAWMSSAFAMPPAPSIPSTLSRWLHQRTSRLANRRFKAFAFTVIFLRFVASSLQASRLQLRTDAEPWWDERPASSSPSTTANTGAP